MSAETRVIVSVPFAKGTTSLRRSSEWLAGCICRFSPLREGDNIIAETDRDWRALFDRFSPLREGDNIIARQSMNFRLLIFRVSVPFAKGTTSLPHVREPSGALRYVSVPFAKGTTSLRRLPRLLPRLLPVSVPFAKGTTSLHRASPASRTCPEFQSPSRRGQHHCGTPSPHRRQHQGFQSPSRRGQHHCGENRSAPPLRVLCFSPLREGDNIIAYAASPSLNETSPVSVPFAKGTTSLQDAGNI